MREKIAGADENIRDVFVKIVLNDDEGTVYEADDIISVDIVRAVTDGSFGIGFAASDRLACTIISAEKVAKKTRVTVYIKFSDDEPYTRLGRFYCDSCTRDGAAINIIAYDKMYSQTQKLIGFAGVASKNLAPLSFPCTVQQMLDYICAYRGFSCDFVCQPFTVAKMPLKNEEAENNNYKYYTVREMLGFIAAAHGCNVRIDNEGSLVFQQFAEVSAELTAANVLDISLDDSEPFRVSGVLIGVGEDVIYIDDVPGSQYDEEADGVIKCSIPFGTLDIANYIWERLGNMSYYGGTIKLRGAGSIECGDVLTLKNLKYPEDTGDCRFCVTGIRYSIDRENGFTETLTSEVTRSAAGYSSGSASGGGSGGGGGGTVLPLGDIRITAGRLYVGSEVYKLQRGDDRRVIAVTKGAKCTQIYADTEAESEAAAVAAAVRGLDTPWDMEYDLYRPAGYSISGLGGATLEGSYSRVEVDYGDGSDVYKGATIPDSHTYTSAGVYHVRVKTDAKTVRIDLLGDYWEQLKSSDVKRFNEGISVYVGGGIENVRGSSQQMYVGRLTFGESVVKIANLNGIGSGLGRKQYDIGLPPNFTMPVSGYTAVYSGSPINYLYIPESCTIVTDHAFAEMALRQVEIEPKGETLTLLGFNFAAASSNWSEIPVVEIPARIQLPPTMYQGKIFNGCGVRLARFESGMTAIPAYCLYGANHTDGLTVSGITVIESGDRPLSVFVPKTVTNIGSGAFSTCVGIVYEGTQAEWESVSLAGDWCSGNDADCTFRYCGGSAKYRAVWEAEKEKLVRASSGQAVNIGRGLKRLYDGSLEADISFGLKFNNTGQLEVNSGIIPDVLFSNMLVGSFAASSMTDNGTLTRYDFYSASTEPKFVIVTENQSAYNSAERPPIMWAAGGSNAHYFYVKDSYLSITQESGLWVASLKLPSDKMSEYDSNFRYYVFV